MKSKSNPIYTSLNHCEQENKSIIELFLSNQMNSKHINKRGIIALSHYNYYTSCDIKMKKGKIFFFLSPKER